MTAPTDANDVLFGSNAPSAKFEQPGTTVGGIITSPPRSKQEQEWNNATQRGDGPPKFFPSGDPIMSVMIDVQTQLRDPSIQNDDGIRTIYVQGKRMKDAVRDAVRQSGAQRLEVGAEIWVTFTHFGEAPSVGANQPKEWAVRYVPAASTAMGLSQQQPPAQQVAQQPVQQYQQPPAQQVAPVLSTASGQPVVHQQQIPAPQQPMQQQTPPVQQPPAQPVQQPVAQTPANQPTPEQVAGLLANRMDPRTVFPAYQLTPDQAQQVAGFTQQG